MGLGEALDLAGESVMPPVAWSPVAVDARTGGVRTWALTDTRRTHAQLGVGHRAGQLEQLTPAHAAGQHGGAGELVRRG